MKAIGFRAEPKAVSWAVVDGSNVPLVLVAKGKLAAPKTFSEPASLAWYRTQIQTLVDEYQPEKGAVRYPEPSARQGKPTSTHLRVRVEGVILESLHTRGLPVLVGALGTMTARLEADSAKAYIETGKMRGLDISTLPDNIREAVVVAAAALGSADANSRHD